MRKRVRGILLAGAVLMGTLTACDNTAENSSQASEKTQVSVMHFNQLEGFEKLVESTYSDIDLVVEQNATATLDNESERRLKNGHGTDLIMTTLPGGAVKEYTYDISAEEFVLNYSSAMTKLLLVNGQTRYIPLPGQYYGYVINETLVSELGMELPKNNEDIYKLLETAEEKNLGTGSGGDCIGFYTIGENYLANLVFGNYVPDFLSTPDGIIWLEELGEGKAKFSGSFEPSMNFLMHCVEKGFFDSGTNLSGSSGTISNKNSVHVLERMQNRSMIMAYGDVELYRRLTDGEGTDKFTMIPFLSYENRPGWVISIGSGYLAVNKSLEEAGNEQKLDAALKVLDLLSTEEGQKAWMEDTKAVVSYLKDGVNLSQDIPEGISETVTSGNVFNSILPHNIAQYFGRQMAMVISGKSTVEAAMTAVDNYNKTGADSNDEASTIVGKVATDLLYENYNTRREETAIGNLIADAVRDFSGADIALVNGGSIRSSLYEGEVWDADLAAVCPYGNKIITVNAKGSVIKQALTNGISQTDRGENVPGGRFLQVSGINYSFKPMKDENDVGQLLSVTLADGTEIEDDKEYLISITDYMAGSSTYSEGNGDGYVMFNVYDENEPKSVTLVKETEATYRDALKAYFEAAGDKTVSAVTEGRIKIEQ